jgi:phosphoribosylformylglycinamidine synthase PurS subunit
MARRRQIYEGKAKILYEGPEPGTLIQYFKDDATAFNAQKKGTINGKGVLNNRISEHVFTLLDHIGVPTHFIRRLNMREQLIRQVEIVPIEVVVRNVAAGSLSKRLGIEEGTKLPRTIIEYYFKDDALGDPMISDEHIAAFGWASQEEMHDIADLAIRINDFPAACLPASASGWSISSSNSAASGTMTTVASSWPTRSAPTAAVCGTWKPTTRWTRTASARIWAARRRLIRRSRAGSACSRRARTARCSTSTAIASGAASRGSKNMKIKVFVTLKPGVLDPQGKAIEHALGSLGFEGVGEVRAGKLIEMEVAGDTEDATIDAMCRKLLANTVIENYRIERA